MGKKKSGAGTIILVILIFVLIIALVCMCAYIYNLENKQANNSDTQVAQTNNDSNKKDINSDGDDEEQQNNLEEKRENINLESDVGKQISDYIEKIFIEHEVYGNCIAEFDDLNSAAKEYLAACAARGAWRNLGDSMDIYDAKVTIDDFNSALIELFGKNADGMVDSKDVEEIFFVQKNGDGTYHFMGFDGSETEGKYHSIYKIEKEGNKYFVEQYEYSVKLDSVMVDLKPGDEMKENVYDLEGNLVTTITIRANKMDENIIHYANYSENGEEIEDDNYIVNNFADKLSIRKIELEYDEGLNLFYMVSNKLER